MSQENRLARLLRTMAERRAQVRRQPVADATRDVTETVQRMRDTGTPHPSQYGLDGDRNNEPPWVPGQSGTGL